MTDKTQEIFEKLGEQVATWREELGVPGCSVGISHDGAHHTFSDGVTNANHPLDVNEETIFQIGSITKTYTATVIMRLAEEGKLNLDDPVQKFIPDFRVKDEDVSAKVTVQHLITHSAGWIGDVFTDTGDNDDAIIDYIKEMADLDQLAPPDKVFSYNNSAFVVAGHVIEVATGNRYEDVVKEMIFDPLGLEHSFFFPKDVMTYRFAVGHRVESEEDEPTQVLRPWPIPRSSNPAGGIACHIKDLLRYGEFHLGDGTAGDTRLLTQELLAKMHTPHFSINDQTGSVGLAWMVGDFGGSRTLRHGGGTLGQISQLILLPEYNFVFGMLTNADRGSMLIQNTVKWLFKELFDLEDPEPVIQEASEDDLKQYVALYSRPIMDTRLTLEDGKLMAQLHQKQPFAGEIPPDPPPFELHLCGVDQMVVTEGPYKDLRVEFLRDDQGDIAYVRLGGRINPRVD